MNEEEILKRAEEIKNEQIALKNKEREEKFAHFLEEFQKLEKQFGFTFSSRFFLTADGRVSSDIIIVEYINKEGG